MLHQAVYKHGETSETTQGLKVFVYYNLHKHVFSVKALEGRNKGRVIAHADMVKLEGATFKVSEAGRQRVLREKKKNVHAGVQGTLKGLEHAFTVYPEFLEWRNYCKAYYNPYKCASFMNGEQPLHTANKVCLVEKQIYFK